MELQKVTQLGLELIAEEFESYDELLRKRKNIRQGLYIVRQDEMTLTTSLGDVVYKKILFRNKETGCYSYQLDELMEIASHTRITEDAVARILDEAVESGYRKGGRNACITGGNISKRTVMNKTHALEFPKVESKRKSLKNCILMRMRIMCHYSTWKQKEILRSHAPIRLCQELYMHMKEWTWRKMDV